MAQAHTIQPQHVAQPSLLAVQAGDGGVDPQAPLAVDKQADDDGVGQPGAFGEAGRPHHAAVGSSDVQTTDAAGPDAAIGSRCHDEHLLAQHAAVRRAQRFRARRTSGQPKEPRLRGKPEAAVGLLDHVPDFARGVRQQLHQCAVPCA
jgi:hypothetical protein